MNYHMYIDDIKIFVKNKNEQETLIQTIRIYNRYIGMEFGIEKCTMLMIKKRVKGGARGVMVIVVGNGHGDTSSNPGPD